MANQFTNNEDFVVTHSCGCVISFPAAMRHMATNHKPCDAHVNHEHLGGKEKIARTDQRYQLVEDAHKQLQQARDAVSGTADQLATQNKPRITVSDTVADQS